MKKNYYIVKLDNKYSIVWEIDIKHSKFLDGLKIYSQDYCGERTENETLEALLKELSGLVLFLDCKNTERYIESVILEVNDYPYIPVDGEYGITLIDFDRFRFEQMDCKIIK